MGPHGLANYIIKGKMKFNRKIFPNGEQGLQVEILLERKLSSIFFVTYLPTILMNVINQMTNYFKGDDIFEGIIVVNLTCMMVLSALYISVSNSLPVTSSIKYVEIWLLFSLVYPFFVVSIQTWIHTNKMENITNDRVTPILTPTGHKWRQTINGVTKVMIGEIIAKYVIPGFGIIFTIFYFWIGLLQ